MIWFRLRGVKLSEVFIFTQVLKINLHPVFLLFHYLKVILFFICESDVLILILVKLNNYYLL